MAASAYDISKYSLLDSDTMVAHSLVTQLFLGLHRLHKLLHAVLPSKDPDNRPDRGSDET